MIGPLIQSAQPPYEFVCHACGQTWTPPPARGQTQPTDSSLDRAAVQHFVTCQGRNPR